MTKKLETARPIGQAAFRLHRSPVQAFAANPLHMQQNRNRVLEDGSRDRGERVPANSLQMQADGCAFPSRHRRRPRHNGSRHIA
jgi:hypothetical protein